TLRRIARSQWFNGVLAATRQRIWFPAYTTLPQGCRLSVSLREPGLTNFSTYQSWLPKGHVRTWGGLKRKQPSQLPLNPPKTTLCPSATHRPKPGVLSTIPHQKFSGHRSRIAWFAESFFR